MSSYSSDSTFFKILPSYKHQKESEGIIYSNDVVYISCANNYLNKVPYIHCHEDRSQKQQMAKKHTVNKPLHNKVSTLSGHHNADQASTRAVPKQK